VLAPALYPAVLTALTCTQQGRVCCGPNKPPWPNVPCHRMYGLMVRVRMSQATHLRSTRASSRRCRCRHVDTRAHGTRASRQGRSTARDGRPLSVSWHQNGHPHPLCHFHAACRPKAAHIQRAGGCKCVHGELQPTCARGDCWWFGSCNSLHAPYRYITCFRDDDSWRLVALRPHCRSTHQPPQRQNCGEQDTFTQHRVIFAACVVLCTRWCAAPRPW
jgi:hypothetical protein